MGTASNQMNCKGGEMVWLSSWCEQLIENYREHQI